MSSTGTSSTEVIRDGLRALITRDRAVETWLTNQVGPASDALKADPSRAVTADQVRAQVRFTGDAAAKNFSERSRLARNPPARARPARIAVRDHVPLTVPESIPLCSRAIARPQGFAHQRKAAV
jgi:hypothetical protein